VTVKYNVISSPRGRAIHLETIQGGTVQTNSITDCALENIRVDKSSDVNVTDNRCDNAGPFADSTNAIVFNASRNTTAEKNYVTTKPGARPPETKSGN
jgi:hypothetical protein